jgi:hypothetical protein
MGTVEFQGAPPYDLPFAQSAEARGVDEIVEVTLRVSLRGKLPSPAPIRVRMTVAVAKALSGQLQPAATAAELWARNH